MSGESAPIGRSFTPRGIRYNSPSKREIYSLARLLHLQCQTAYHHLRVIQPTEQLLSVPARRIAEDFMDRTGPRDPAILIRILLNAMQIHHSPTLHHQKHVGELVRRLCDELRINNGKTSVLVQAALVHDSGKLLIPTNLLDMRTDGPASNDERAKIEFIKIGHLFFGYHLLCSLDLPNNLTTLVGRHHYLNNYQPLEFAGSPVTTEDQILVVADNFDALTKGRGYRDGNFVSNASALETISSLPVEREIIDALRRLTMPAASAR